MRIKILLGLIIFFCLSNIFAQEEKAKPGIGLSVQPGGLLIQYVKPGETYDLYKASGIALTIENKDTRPRTYIITASKPSRAGNKKWLPGYLEIPDPGWFWLEKNEVTIEAQSKQQVKMFLKIPPEEKYYNQHWAVSLGVSGKPETGSMLVLAVYPRYQIETESKSGLKEKPDGVVGVEPSALLFEGLTLGKKQSSQIIIYNNDNKAHKYRISLKVIGVDPTREQIVNSPGYAWVPRVRWLSINKKSLTIEPSQSKELEVAAHIPKKAKYSQQKWEALIFVEPEEGPSGFVRVQMITD